jgi:hypothetical protein
MLDLLVAFTLLAAIFSAVTPLMVRHAQLLQSQRNYRLALDELSNQLERLTALSPAELPTALTTLRPSPFIVEHLGQAKLTGEFTPTDGGGRVTLKLLWSEVGGRTQPATMVGWVFAPPTSASPSATSAAEGGQP